MQNGTLQHALESECGLRFAQVIRSENGRCFLKKILQVFLELLHIRAAGAKNFHSRRVIEQCQ